MNFKNILLWLLHVIWVVSALLLLIFFTVFWRGKQTVNPSELDAIYQQEIKEIENNYEFEKCSFKGKITYMEGRHLKKKYTLSPTLELDHLEYQANDYLIKQAPSSVQVKLSECYRSTNEILSVKLGDVIQKEAGSNFVKIYSKHGTLKHIGPILDCPTNFNVQGDRLFCGEQLISEIDSSLRPVGHYTQYNPLLGKEDKHPYILMEGNYIAGKRNGDFTFYYNTVNPQYGHRILRKCKYVDGTIVSQKDYLLDGSVVKL